MCRIRRIMEQIITGQLMRDLPSDERPYEKCRSYGPGALSDAELLAVVLRTGSKGQSALSLARRLLQTPNCRDGIQGICNYSLAELTKQKGIGAVKGIQILCVAELSRRIAKSTAGRRLCFSSPETIADYYMEDLRHEKQEKIILILLNTRGDMICDRVMYSGTVSFSPVSPREIFLEALRYEAVNIVLLHNHPSGDPTPSREDILLTKRLLECGRLLNVPLTDHIIIGDRKYLSFREEGLLD